MKRYKISWRVSPGPSGPEGLRGFLDAITRGGQAGDEVWFFIDEPTSFGYEPLEDIARKCEAIRPLVEAARARGVKPVINPWPDFGDEGFPGCPRPLPFQPMVGWDGTAAKRVACPVSPEFLSYTRSRFRLFAQTGASAVWVDDDCRFTHLNLPYPCFCPRCVAGFENGAYKSREDLVSALNRPENKALRRAWCHYGALRLARYCREVRSAVDEIDPAIETPFMSVGYSHTTFAGDYIEECMAALRAKAGRPGHGFYWDDAPMGMFNKAMDVTEQIAAMPEAALDDVQYEEESHPRTPGGKTVDTRLMEMALSIWAGCTGVAMHHDYDAAGADPYRLIKKEASRLVAARPFFDRYLDAASRLPQAGVWAAYSEWRAANREVGPEGWLGGNGEFGENRTWGLNDYDPRQCVREWPCFGTAVTARPEGAYAALLQGKMPELLDDDELDRVLSGPVFMDGLALETLWKRGFGERCGVRVLEPDTRTRLNGGVSGEALADTPYAPGFAGAVHPGLGGKVYRLQPLAADAEILSVNPADGAPVSVRSGHTVVFGFNPYLFTGVPGWQTMLRGLQKSLGAPVVLEPDDPYDVLRVSVWARADSRRAAVLLVNSQTASAGEFGVCFRGSAQTAFAEGPNGERVPLAVRREGDYLKAAMPTMIPWAMRVVYFE